MLVDKLPMLLCAPATPVDKLLTLTVVLLDRLPILLLAPATPVDKLLT